MALYTEHSYSHSSQKALVNSQSFFPNNLVRDLWLLFIYLTNIYYWAVIPLYAGTILDVRDERMREPGTMLTFMKLSVDEKALIS